MNIKIKKAGTVQEDGAVHDWFELTYASYLVLPRSILQSAPLEWQKRFVGCLEELEGMFGVVPETGVYEVQLREHGAFITDSFRDYERGRRRIPCKTCIKLEVKGQ